MEQKNIIQSYFKGIIGALIGGAIATIPWVLAYVYGNVMLSLLAVLIAACEFYGYKLFKGKIDNKLPAIIISIAIIVVTIATLVVIPAMILKQQNLTVSIQAIKNLYTYNNFTTAIMRDYIISLVFTILGAAVVTSNIKKQLVANAKSKDIKLDLVNTDAQIALKSESIKTIKPVFQRYNALDKENTILKEEVLAEIENKNAKLYFNCLQSLAIIKKIKGKYYYSVEDEPNNTLHYSVNKIAVVIIAVIVIILSITMIFVDKKNTTQTTVYDDNIEYSVTTDWTSVSSDSNQNGWTYYKYISNTPTIASSTNTEDTNTINYEEYPATITVNYEAESNPKSSFSSADDVKGILETYMEEVVQPDSYDAQKATTDKGYDIVKAKVEYYSEPLEIDYIYYIYYNNKIAYISGSAFNQEDDEQLKIAVDAIANSFVWKN